jgi:hypothetical protein
VEPTIAKVESAITCERYGHDESVASKNLTSQSLVLSGVAASRLLDAAAWQVP